MGNFQYKTGGTWVDVPDTAHPDDDQGSIVVEYPAATARDGTGLPCAAIGSPRIVIRFGRMIGTGMAFWLAFFSAVTDLSATMTGLTAYDPRTATWVKYTGTLLRPTFSQVQPTATAARTWYMDGEIVIDQVTVTT